MTDIGVNAAACQTDCLLVATTQLRADEHRRLQLQPAAELSRLNPLRQSGSSVGSDNISRYLVTIGLIASFCAP